MVLSLYRDSSVRFVTLDNTFSTVSITVSVRRFFSVVAIKFKLISVLVSSDEFICPVHTCTDFKLISQQLCVNRDDISRFIGLQKRFWFPDLFRFELLSCNYYFYSERVSHSAYLNAEA